MQIVIVTGLLIIVSFLVALRSMKDFAFAKELEKLIEQRNVKGMIVFFKDKVEHYSSKSSSVSMPK